MNSSDSGAGIGEPFDQTNGLVDGLDGDSDGTAAAESTSAAERESEDVDVEDGDSLDVPIIPPAGRPTATP